MRLSENDNKINIGRELADIILEILKEEKNIYEDFIDNINTRK